MWHANFQQTDISIDFFLNSITKTKITLSNLSHGSFYWYHYCTYVFFYINCIEVSLFTPKFQIFDSSFKNMKRKNIKETRNYCSKRSNHKIFIYLENADVSGFFWQDLRKFPSFSFWFLLILFDEINSKFVIIITNTKRPNEWWMTENWLHVKYFIEI